MNTYTGLVIKPMLAKTAREPFDSEEYLFELKWDGTRCIALIDGQRIKLQNRRLRDITYRYPEFKNLTGSIKSKALVLDGEIVVFYNGKPDFEKLQTREQIEDRQKINLLSTLTPATYVVFDILYLKNQSLMKLPLMERKRILKEVINLSEHIVISEDYNYGKRLFYEALKRGFEGIMAKQKKSPYLIGKRSEYWLKIKKSSDIDAVVCGFIKGEGLRKGLAGSLILGAFQKGELIHIGQVGTGFSISELEHFMKMAERLKTHHPTCKDIPYLKREVQWLRPEIVVRVRFLEWTRERRLRSPVFLNFRFDKAPEECEIED
jgi:bifunctional non-homologous end joining protein LigD